MVGKIVRWGILGTGNIAGVFAQAVKNSHTGRLHAVASRNETKASQFAKDHDAQHYFGSYEALISDPSVDIVYIALPNVLHAHWAILAANAGKHVLCEKPLAMNYAQARSIVDSAKRNDVFLMEAFMYRCHPQTARLRALLRESAIGEIRCIQATFSFHAERSHLLASSWRELGTGGILDVGCYPVSMARLIAGVAMEREFVDPIEVCGAGHIGEESKIDEWAICSLKFPNGVLAQLAAGISLAQENVVRIFGSHGDILVPSPWVPGGRNPGVTKIFIRRRGDPSAQEIVTETKLGVYALEADAVVSSIKNRQSVYMGWEDSLGNMRTLDQWRQCIGISYAADTCPDPGKSNPSSAK